MATRKFRIVYMDKDGKVLKQSSDFFVNKAEAIKFAQLQFAKDENINHWNVTEIDLNSEDEQPMASAEESIKDMKVRKIVESFIFGTGVSSAGVPSVYSRFKEERGNIDKYPFLVKLGKYLNLDPYKIGDFYAGNTENEEVKDTMDSILGKCASEMTDKELSNIGSSREELNQFFNSLN